MTKPTPRVFPAPAELIALVLLAAFAMALVVVPPPNLDIWWLLAVGRRMTETHAFIYHDPFTFTVPGTPWSPQSWASALVYYGLFKLGGMTAISALRVLLTGLVAALVLRAQRRAGVSWVVASPLVVVALLAAQGRFVDRGQLFEYAFLAWQMGFLLGAAQTKGRRFFVVPPVVQLAWVQFHSSFLLGPALAAIFFSGEWLAGRLPGMCALRRHDYRRAALLVLLLVAACAINPNPRAFLLQPFDSAQHELISRFTLEWKSPFDAAIAHADFHPWYEIMLGAAALAILVRVPSLPLAPVLLLIATALLSLQSHRFRVEFVLVAAVMVPLLLRESRLVARLARRLPRAAWAGTAAAVSLALVATHSGRVTQRPVRNLTPQRALAFVADNGIARRPFHTIGFGSFMLWDLYGERRTFIDGRNFDAGVYGDFLRAQTNAPALRAVAQKYRVDAFIIPPPERSDAGMHHVHESLLSWGDAWPLVYMDEDAFVYVARAGADSTWLTSHEYRAYHPLTFVGKPHTRESFERAMAELDRITTESPDYPRAWMDLGQARLSIGDNHGAASAYANLASALVHAGDSKGALTACRRALELDPKNAQARELSGRMRTDS